MHGTGGADPGDRSRPRRAAVGHDGALPAPDARARPWPRTGSTATRSCGRGRSAPASTRCARSACGSSRKASPATSRSSSRPTALRADRRRSTASPRASSLSGLMLAAPCETDGASDARRTAPGVAALLRHDRRVMRAVRRHRWWRAGSPCPAGTVTIEPRRERSRSYFFAAAAITGGRVTVPGLGSGSVPRRPALRRRPRADGSARGAERQLHDGDRRRPAPRASRSTSPTCPTPRPTLAVVAPFASTPTRGHRHRVHPGEGDRPHRGGRHRAAPAAASPPTKRPDGFVVRARRTSATARRSRRTATIGWP